MTRVWFGAGCANFGDGETARINPQVLSTPCAEETFSGMEDLGAKQPMDALIVVSGWIKFVGLSRSPAAPHTRQVSSRCLICLQGGASWDLRFFGFFFNFLLAAFV